MLAPRFDPPERVPCEIDPKDWKRPFVLTRDFTFEGWNVKVTVPAGFRYDGASVPRLLWWWIPPFDPRIFRAATIHDQLYWEQTTERAIADAIFLSIMALDGMPRLKRWAAYLGVRLGGWRPWGARMEAQS